MPESNNTPTKAGEQLWQPPKSVVEAANITQFAMWLEKNKQEKLDDYHDIWRWSVDNIPSFWEAIWEYFEIIFDGNIEEIVSTDPMPGTKWFTGTNLNFAEHVMRNETNGNPDRTVLKHCSELRPLSEMSWREMCSNIRRLATQLRAMGVRPGDRVVAYMPNIPETMIAMLATASIGATWSAAAPEFGAQTVVDRFGQIGPTVLFAVNGYRYGGKNFDRIADLGKIINKLDSLEHLVMLDYLPGTSELPKFSGKLSNWRELLSTNDITPEDFQFERVPSNHALWILFSSGTTGLPKPIVHGHHGIILEHYKSAAFHFDLKRNDCQFFYSTTGWMVWNTLMWGPLMDGTSVLYDGHPGHPDISFMWELADKTQATLFATNPTFLQIVQKHNFQPSQHFDFSYLKTIMLVGSPATPEAFSWVYKNVKDDIWVASQSGGTEFCSGLLAGAPTMPVLAGEIQARGLATDAQAFDDNGNVITGEIGELVICKPLPSMPLFLWGDQDGYRYHSTYFETFQNVWTHGDRVSFNSNGGCFIHGRSDATLNRFGVRIGSAEVYRTIESFPEIDDSLIVCIEEEGGAYYMPLFVCLFSDQPLDNSLIEVIRFRLKTERSPRHVPDEIISVPAIPVTLTGKKLEVPVRRLLLGDPIEKVVSKGALKNPSALDWFVEFAKSRRESLLSKS